MGRFRNENEAGVRRGSSAASPEPVELYGRMNKSLQRLLVDRLALADVDGAPGATFRLALNKPAGSSSEAPWAKVSFTVARVGLTGADEAGVLPTPGPRAFRSTAFAISPPRPRRGRPP